MKLFLYLLGILNLELILCEEFPQVTVSQGILEGRFKKSYKGRNYAAFEGIPYAKPPVGELRFEKPQKAESWEGVLVANITYMCLSFLPVPIMHGARGSEDCLYIYVYVPRENIDPNENLDVVVHIHGGAFMLGSPKLMAEPTYIMDKDVVFVSFNYRLGILGFLSTEDEVVPGNMGLKDQTLALKWIKDNIKAFGGNPESITITGLSAGGASVHFHYLSPMSKGLFHRGLSQSGTSLQPWAITENAKDKAISLAKHLNCSIEDSKKLVECLKEVDGKKLVNALPALLFFMEAVPYTPFGPVIEKSPDGFLTDYPIKLLQEGKQFDVPWITSNVLEEGLYPAGFMVLFNKLDEINSNWDQLMVYTLDIFDTVEEKDKLDVVRKVKEFYMKNENVTLENIWDFVKIFTDRVHVLDSQRAVKAQAKTSKSPIYYYYFSYVSAQPSLFRGIRKGVAHSDDAKFLFKIFTTPNELEENDEKMMELFVDFIAGYAKTGVPSFKGIEWKAVDPNSEEIDFMDIKSPEDVSINKKKEFVPVDFWNSLPIHEHNDVFLNNGL